MTSEDSFIDFKCPYCGEMMSFPSECAGFPQECFNCREAVMAPADGAAIGGKIPLPLQTARLAVRRLSTSDWKDMLALMAERGAVAPSGHPFGESEIIQWLESDSHIRLTTPDQPFRLGLEDRASKKLAGWIALHFTDATRLQAALDVFVGGASRKQGIGGEGMGAVLEFCFNGIRLHRVSASCLAENAAAARLFEKSGMRREGEFREDHWTDGGWKTTLHFGMLAADFRAGKNAGA